MASADRSDPMHATEAPGGEDITGVEEMRALAVGAVRPTPPVRIPLGQAAWLTLAEAVVAATDLPRFPNAAMDGYAVRASDVAAAPVTLLVVGRAFAGHPATVAVGPGEAVAVATGAAIPDGADAVVPIEEVREEGPDRVVVMASAEPGRHVRRAGEDVRAGQTVLEVGAVLGPGQVAAAAALGVDVVTVRRRPLIAVVPTGDEVRAAGEALGPGQVHDAVSPALALLLDEVGAVPAVQPVAPDDPDALTDALGRAAAGADAVVTVGGVSMGQRDVVGRLRAGAVVRAYRVALRPAKPFALGRVRRRPLFGLPGNPASALAAFEELVRPAILAMMGRVPAVRRSHSAALAEPVRQVPGRLHLLRAEVWAEGDRLLVRPAGRQGAGMIHSLARANAWAVIPPGDELLLPGSEVLVRLVTETA